MSASSGSQRPSAATGGRRLGVRTVDKARPDVRGLAQAFVGVILARRFESRDEANQALKDYPMLHTATGPETGKPVD